MSDQASRRTSHTCDGGSLHLRKPTARNPYPDLEATPIHEPLWAATVPCPHCCPDEARGALATNTAEATTQRRKLERVSQVVRGDGATRITAESIRLRMIASVLRVEFVPTVSIHDLPDSTAETANRRRIVIDHMLDDLTERDGWSVAVCACGAESPPCPDAVTAANFWGQHLLGAASRIEQLGALRELEQLVREVMRSSAPMTSYTADIEDALDAIDSAAVQPLGADDE